MGVSMATELLSSADLAQAHAWFRIYGPTALGAGLGLFAWAVRHPGFFFFLTLPGVIVHELSHWIAAALLGGRPSRLSIVPVQDPAGYWVLGSVRFHATWWNGSFVALAPLVGNVAVAAACLVFSPQDVVGGATCGYLAAVILRHASLSRTDLGIVLRQPAGLFAILGLATWVLQVNGVLG